MEKSCENCKWLDNFLNIIGEGYCPLIGHYSFDNKKEGCSKFQSKEEREYRLLATKKEVEELREDIKKCFEEIIENIDGFSATGKSLAIDRINYILYKNDTKKEEN